MKKSELVQLIKEVIKEESLSENEIQEIKLAASRIDNILQLILDEDLNYLERIKDSSLIEKLFNLISEFDMNLSALDEDTSEFD